MNNKLESQLENIKRFEKEILRVKIEVDNLLSEAAELNNKIKNKKEFIINNQDLLQKEYVVLGELLRNEK